MDLFRINNTLKPKSGRIIFSEPLSHDYFFGRSVVLLAEHNESGTVGFIINKESEIKIGKIITGMEKYNIPVYIGGPVATNTLHFIHIDRRINNSLEIGDNLYWGGDLKDALSLIESGKLYPGGIKFFIGYSGWSPDQLNQEISKDYWVVSTLPATEIFSAETKKVWKNAVLSSGEKYSYWLNVPKNIIEN